MTTVWALTVPTSICPAGDAVPHEGRHLYYLTLIVVSVAVAACYFFLKTHLGNSIVCIRERDVRASFLGYNVFLTRLTAYAAAGALAAIAGGLFVVFQEIVAPRSSA